jgi:Zn-dependent M28 family amino/carboxypeptidase
VKKFLSVFISALVLVACTPETPTDNSGETNPPPSKPRVAGPAFNADSAYSFVKTQVEFGPRIPGTKEHDACADYYVNKLKSYGLTVSTQTSPATAYTGLSFTLKNIFAQYNPENKERILLLAHWDTRPYSDLDADTAMRKKPFDGADDGASGVAVLMEIARIISQKDPNIGVDFLLSDAEDMGDNGGASETWCLGTQYWTQHMPVNYNARFAVLLDMVGGIHPVFPREGTSVVFAASTVEKIWSAAQKIGYGNVFTNDQTGQTTDDHLYVNEYARIPCVDIVHYEPSNHDYPEWHHKQSDKMDIIDKNTLEIVGKVLVDVIWNENPQ